MSDQTSTDQIPCSHPSTPPCPHPATGPDELGRACCDAHRERGRTEPELETVTDDDHGSWRVIAIHVPGRPGIVARGVVRFEGLRSGVGGQVGTEMNDDELGQIAGVRLRRVAVDTVTVPGDRPGETIRRGRVNAEAITVDAAGRRASMFWQAVQLWFDAPGHEGQIRHVRDVDAQAARATQQLVEQIIEVEGTSPSGIARALLAADVDPGWLEEILAAQIRQARPDRDLPMSLAIAGVDLETLLHAVCDSREQVASLTAAAGVEPDAVWHAPPPGELPRRALTSTEFLEPQGMELQPGEAHTGVEAPTMRLWPGRRLPLHSWGDVAKEGGEGDAGAQDQDMAGDDEPDDPLASVPGPDRPAVLLRDGHHLGTWIVYLGPGAYLAASNDDDDARVYPRLVWFARWDCDVSELPGTLVACDLDREGGLAVQAVPLETRLDPESLGAEVVWDTAAWPATRQVLGVSPWVTLDDETRLRWMRAALAARDAT